MTNLVPLAGRAADTDADGDLVPIAVTAFFFEAGSTTPLTVYDAPDLVTPLGTSVVSDAQGVFPQCWTDVATLKIDVVKTDLTSLAGFPQDNLPTLVTGGTNADEITFTPVTGNAATDLQAAVANDVTRLNRFDNAADLATSGGSAGAYTLTSKLTITAYTTDAEFEFVANHASVGGGSDTLNVDGVGAVVFKKYSGSTTKADLAAGDIKIGNVVRVKYDGAHFVIVGFRIDVLDSDTFTGATSTNVPSAESTKAYVDSRADLSGTPTLTSYATATDRVINTAYTNSGTKPMLVWCFGESTTNVFTKFQIAPDASTWEDVGQIMPSTFNSATNVFFVLLPGWSYRYIDGTPVEDVREIVLS